MSGETLCKHGVNTSNPCPLCRLDKKMSTLDQWEAECTGSFGSDSAIKRDYRIKTLIDIVRKKDEALSCFVFDEDIPYIGKSYWLDEHDLKRAKEALALTERILKG